MKVIFLDFDGVLNVNYGKRDKHGTIFHPQFVDNLRLITNATGAKIVCSSSWRKSGLDKMQLMWQERGMPSELIDCTASIRLQKGGCIGFFNGKLDRHPTESVGGYSIPRGCEIEYWLKEEGKFLRINYSKEEQIKRLDAAIVKNYVILDDDSDMLYGQREHFVKCSLQDVPDAVEGFGLTREAAIKSIDILNKDLIDLYY